MAREMNEIQEKLAEPSFIYLKMII